MMKYIEEGKVKGTVNIALSSSSQMLFTCSISSQYAILHIFRSNVSSMESEMLTEGKRRKHSQPPPPPSRQCLCAPDGFIHSQDSPLLSTLVLVSQSTPSH